MPKTEAMILAAQIKASGLTRQEAADKLGVSRKTLWTWVTGRARIPYSIQVSAARLLK